jgi:tRNA(adenine34) deaminase
MKLPSIEFDRGMMMKCIALSREAGAAGEYPYGAVITRGADVVITSGNRVTQDGDVTHHAEMVTISAAQKLLRTVSLDDCTIYSSAEPCALCSYAIRESRIGRVVYGLPSPHMGGVSRWNVLTDDGLSQVMPEVFAPPPEIVSGFMAKEAEQALVEWNPLAALILQKRGLLGTPSTGPHVVPEVRFPRRLGFFHPAMQFLRREFFDHFGRR